MDKIDFRSRGRAAQEALRTQAVYLVRRVGKTQVEAAEAVGVSRQVVNRWLRRHAQGGDEALLDGRRVSPRKGRGLLTVAEAKRVQGWIRDKCPDQLKLPYVLWTTAVVRELIRRKLGKDLAETTVRLYLTRWDFTPQKPLSRASQRSDAAIQRWLEREHPKIARRAKREKALIYWGDETGISNQDQVGRSYAPKGHTPVVRRTARKVTTSMIAAVNNRGLMRFMCFKGALNAGLFIDFLRRLIKGSSGKQFLIVDNLRVHKAVKVSRWVAAHSDEIELFFLPPYAPEHRVNLGITHDTAAFAVESIRRWWHELGAARYPAATRLLITADCGGSNGVRVRLWKRELQVLADELGIAITVCHLPPGTSKWNRIEHRLFAFITQNWRGKPLVSHQVIVQLIANTRTNTGLTVACQIDANAYDKGIKVSDAEMAALNIQTDDFHGEWNYTFAPRRPDG